MWNGVKTFLLCVCRCSGVIGQNQVRFCVKHDRCILLTDLGSVSESNSLCSLGSIMLSVFCELLYKYLLHGYLLNMQYGVVAFLVNPSASLKRLQYIFICSFSMTVYIHQ